MSQRNAPKTDTKFHHPQLTRTTRTFKTPEPASGPGFTIFTDKWQTGTPRRFAPSTFEADFDGSNDENFNSTLTSKFVNKPTTKTESALSLKPTLLAGGTQKSVGQPRSLPAALVEIARLEDELEASKGKIRELRGEIVAYQDALYQADEDIGYF